MPQLEPFDRPLAQPNKTIAPRKESEVQQDLLNQGQTLARLRRFAWLMDSSIALPGGIRVGLDGLLGLLPVVGDVVGALIAGYVVFCGQRLKMPKQKLALMVWNILFELVLGCIPVLGDLQDFYFKANQKNVRMIETYYAELLRSQSVPAPAHRLRPGVWKYLVLLSLISLALVVGLLWW